MSVYDYLWDARADRQQIVRHLKGTESLLCSIQELQRRGFAESEQATRDGTVTLARKVDEITQAVARVSTGLRDVQFEVASGFAKLASQLQDGFKRIETEIGVSNNYLKEIARLKRENTRTFAYDQYALACEAISLLSYDAAIYYIDNAIDGLGGNPGLRINPDFYYLKGRLHLRNSSDDDDCNRAIDPAVAEKAFTTAAKLCQEDSYLVQAKKGEALLWAGHAALIQGSLDRALTFTTDGFHIVRWLRDGFLKKYSAGEKYDWAKSPKYVLKIINLDLRARYQHVQCLCALGTHPLVASDILLSVFVDDVECIIDAESDAYIQSRPDVYKSALTAATAHYRGKFQMLYERFTTKLEIIESYRFEDVEAATLLKDELDDLKDFGPLSIERAEGGHALGYEGAARMVSAKLVEIQGLFETYRTRVEETLRRRFEEGEASLTAKRTRIDSRQREKECREVEDILLRCEAERGKQKAVARRIRLGGAGVCAGLLFYSSLVTSELARVSAGQPSSMIWSLIALIAALVLVSLLLPFPPTNAVRRTREAAEMLEVKRSEAKAFGASADCAQAKADEEWARARERIRQLKTEPPAF